MSSVRSTCYTCLVYPDSAPSNWLGALADLHVPAAVSPLHDRDVFQDGSGSLKKPHFHVVLKYASLKSPSQAAYDFDRFGGVYPHLPNGTLTDAFINECLVRVPSAMMRYLCHLDEPDHIVKPLYPTDKVLTFSGLNYIEEIQTETSYITTISEICVYLNDHPSCSFSQLTRLAVMQRPLWVPVIVRYSSFFRAYIHD